MKNKIKWLVQDVGIAFDNIEANFDTLARLDLPYHNFGVIPFTNTISNLENILENPSDAYIIRGGTKILKILDGIKSLSEVNKFLTPEQLAHSDQYIKQLKAGVWYDEERFDQAFYKGFELPLLNSDMAVHKIGDILDWQLTEDTFIKPSKDLKAFSAGVVYEYSTLREHINSGFHHPLHEIGDENCIFSSPKKIFSEYRFFVVEGRVVTGSRYILGGKVLPDSHIPEFMMQHAVEYARMYQPAGVFTMDLCDTPDGVKIVEYNCFNASGLYKANVPLLFTALNDFKAASNNV